MVDTVDSAQMEVSNEQSIFVLVPRRAAIKQLKKVNTTFVLECS